MNLLAFCSGLDRTYIAVLYNEKLYSYIISSDDNYHSLYLIKKINDIFSENKMELKNLDAIIVNSGPGSFTGIRVTLSVAKVMAGELNLPLVPLNTAEILLDAFSCDKMLMDARRDMYYLGDRENIILVPKDKISDMVAASDKIVSDKNCSKVFCNTVCFENSDINIADCMLKIGENKLKHSNNVQEFNYLNVCANYIQTPPVF